MWYSIGEVILLKPNCRLDDGKLLKASRLQPAYINI